MLSSLFATSFEVLSGTATEQFLLRSRGMSLADIMKTVRCHSKHLTNIAEENLTNLVKKEELNFLTVAKKEMHITRKNKNEVLGL